MYLLSISG